MKTLTTRKVRKAILPVAGLGTRFLPATKASPKEMLTVVDKPVIQYVVEEALAAGIEEFIFVTGRGKDAIENHFDTPYELADVLKKRGKMKEYEAVMNILPANTKLFYTRQGAPLGLGHAVYQAASLTGNEPFAVLLPDVVACLDACNPTADAIAAYEKTGKSVVVANEVPLERTKNYGILDLSDKGITADGVLEVKRFVEKPQENPPSNLAIFGRYILTPGTMHVLANQTAGQGNEIQLTDAINTILQQECVMATVFKGQHFDCGDKVGWQSANLYFAMKDSYIGPLLLPYVQSIAEQYERREKARTL